MNKKAYYLEVYTFLKNGIIHGDYDGLSFVETEIAEKLGVSRTPVREAIKMLRSEKLLKSVPKKGIVCRSFTAADIAPVYDLAGAIEGMVAYTVARNYKKLDFTEMADSMQRMEEALKAHNKEEWAAADSDLHRVMMQLCGNKFARDSMNGLQTYIEIIRARYTKNKVSFMEASTFQHRESCQAIMMGDADYARTLVQHHWKSTQRQVLGGLSKGE